LVRWGSPTPETGPMLGPLFGGSSGVGAGVGTTTVGLAMTTAVIDGAVTINGSPLQSATAMALSVWTLTAEEAPAIVVERAVAVLMSAASTSKLVNTRTAPSVSSTSSKPNSWPVATWSRRTPKVKPVMVMSEAGTDRAEAKPSFLAAL